MKRQIRVCLAVMLFVGLAKFAIACVWDYDTLAMERERFPNAQELIAGHFVRHSTAYYRWRIADRTRKEILQRTPGDFDDIAVAYDKLGKHEDAIATIQAKMHRWPDEGRYESRANLGTFYIHAGRWQDGLDEINKAIKLNPDAHFGREVYQKLLVEYILQRPHVADKLPLLRKEDYTSERIDGFRAFIRESQSTESPDLKAAVKGVLGMMRFGKHDSPLLLEALGDLLAEGYRDEAKMIAARAYLRASYEVTDPVAAAEYREKAEQALMHKVGWKLADVESDLQAEMKQGNEFFRQITRDEEAWIAAGKNLDIEFAKTYYSAPELTVSYPNYRPPPIRPAAIVIILVALAAFCIAATFLYRRLRRRRAARSQVVE